MIDPTRYDMWATTDREGERTQAAFEQYARVFDTASNRAQLARTMADGACEPLDNGLPAAPFGTLTEALLHWINRQDDADVLRMLADAHVIGADFEAWYAQKGDD